MKVAICLMFKDEHKHLNEFINYHKTIGVDEFLIYDNNSKLALSSSDPTVKINLWLDDGVAKQQRAYLHCINNYRDTYDWIGFIDTDEFIILKTHSNIKSLLSEYDAYDGLAINWLTFGDSYLEKFTSHKEFYLHSDPKNPVNAHVKSFVKPKTVQQYSGNFLHNFPCNLVNENYVPVLEPFSPHSRKKVYIKHCFTRTKKEFEEKVKRGRGDGVPSKENEARLLDWTNLQQEYNFSREETIIWSGENL